MRRRGKATRRRRRPALIVWLTAVGLALVGTAALGIPGAVLLELFLALAGPVARDRLPPDSVWPIAIYLSLLAPFGLPLAWHATRRVRPPGRRRFLVAALWLGFGLLLAALLFRMGL